MVGRLSKINQAAECDICKMQNYRKVTSDYGIIKRAFFDNKNGSKRGLTGSLLQERRRLNQRSGEGSDLKNGEDVSSCI